jgi:hypothetical protein
MPRCTVAVKKISAFALIDVGIIRKSNCRYLALFVVLEIFHREIVDATERCAGCAVLFSTERASK